MPKSKRDRQRKNNQAKARVPLLFTHRKYLRCDDDFPSHGPGNRICVQCSSSSAYAKAKQKVPGRPGGVKGNV